jgi:hypothetical protein
MEMRQRSVWRGSLRLSLVSAVVTISMASTTVAREALVLPDFAATEAVEMRGRDTTAKVYRSNLDFRTDPSPEIGVIYIGATRTMYRLMFHGTQCVETANVPMRALSSPLQLVAGAVVTAQTAGVLDGHPCKIQDAEITADGKTIRFKLWEAQDLQGAPIKIEMRTERGQSSTTYRDIVVGTPDAGLFAPPKNCVPFAKTYQIAPSNK